MDDKITELNPWYVTGLVDGEGSFSVALNTENRKRKNGTTSSYTYWVTVFHINLRGDDKEIIYKMRDFFECGAAGIYMPAKDKENGGLGMASFHVKSRQDLITKVIPHFDNYKLQAKKQHAYNVWREAVLILTQVDSRRPNKFSKQEPTATEEARLREIKEILANNQTGGHRENALQALKNKRVGKVVTGTDRGVKLG